MRERLLTTIVGTFLALVGSLVLIGWLTHTKILIQINPNWIAMQFNSSLAFLLSGLGILFFGFRHSKTSSFFSFLATLISFITILEYAFDLGGGIDQLFWTYDLDYPMHYPGRMSLQTALSFTFGNLSVILLNQAKYDLCDLFAQISSALVVGLAGVSIIGYITGFETSIEWSGFSRMAIQTSFCFLIFGFTIFYLGYSQSPNPQIAAFSIPIATAVFLMTGAMATWQLFRQQEYQSVLNAAKKNSQLLTSYIENRLRETFQAIDRMTARLERPDGYKKNIWETDAKNYLNNFPWIDTLAIFDQNFKKINFFSNLPFNPDLFLATLPQHLIQLIKNGDHLILPSENKKQILYYSPFLTKSTFNGFLFSALDMTNLFESGISSLQLGNYLILFFYQDSPIYVGGNSFSPTVGSPLLAPFSTPYEGWETKLYITDDVINLNISINYVVLVSGIFISFLGGSLVYFIQELKNKQTALKTTNQELVKAKQQADAANIAKSTFLATMSHEIRTPLNAVVGTVELLQETEVSNLQKRYLDRIIYASKSLLNLINDILDFSKIEGGGVLLQPVVINLETLVKNTAEGLFLKAAEKHIALLVELPSQPIPDISLDPFRFQQILSNLGNNSLKFIEKGYVLLRVVWTALDKDRATIHIEVEDTGIGISEEDQQKLFKKFSQVSFDSTRKYGGVGLGLSICKKLVELMNGTIGVRSYSGIGSTFWFDLTVPTIVTPIKNYFLQGKRIFLKTSIEKENQIIAKYITDWKGVVQQVFNPKECDAAIVSFNAMDLIKELKDFKIPTILICGKEAVSLPDNLFKIEQPITPKELYEMLQRIG